MINSVLMIFYYLKQCLPTDLADNLLVRNKIQTFRMLGTETLGYETFHGKTKQISGKTNYTLQNKNSLDSLASNLSYN